MSAIEDGLLTDADKLAVWHDWNRNRPQGIGLPDAYAHAAARKMLTWAAEFVRQSQGGSATHFRQLDVGKVADWLVEAANLEPWEE